MYRLVVMGIVLLGLPTMLQAVVENNPGRFIPFYNGDPNTIGEISVENLQTILDADSDQLFRGIGEFAFYQDPLSGTLLTADPWPEVFQWAADNELIIMIHLNQDQGTELVLGYLMSNKPII